MTLTDRRTRPTRSGTLYVVATPIGNLDDVTLRALKILKEAGLIACEDTRQTGKLLKKYGINGRLVSYFQPKEQRKIPLILEALREGRDVALVSDAGTPGISDPGYPLISRALEEGLPVVPVPGASALTTALSASGLPTHRFLFLGFPPPKKSGILKILESAAEETGTLVLYLPLRRLDDLLDAVEELLGDRRLVVARELTKIHEEFVRGKPSEIRERLSESRRRGEATILIQGKSRKPPK